MNIIEEIKMEALIDLMAKGGRYFDHLIPKINKLMSKDSINILSVLTADEVDLLLELNADIVEYEEKMKAAGLL